MPYYGTTLGRRVRFHFMLREQVSQTEEYRSYALKAAHGLLQWSIEITPITSDLPVLPLELQIVRGWEGDDLLQQAKARVDHLLAFWPPIHGTSHRADLRSREKGKMENKRNIDRAEADARLLAWENEGGALELSLHPEASNDASNDPEDILIHLGRSVVAHWDSLSLPFKRTAFREIAVKVDEPRADLRERMARYIHINHRGLSAANAVCKST
jgi:hypothetical protein